MSVATIMLDISTDVEVVQIDTRGTDGSTFMLRVCATYSGRGLTGRSLSTFVE